MRRVEFTDAEWLAVQLLLGVGAAGLSTGFGPGVQLKRKIEDRHEVEIKIEDIEGVLKKFGAKQ